MQRCDKWQSSVRAGSEVVPAKEGKLVVLWDIAMWIPEDVGHKVMGSQERRGSKGQRRKSRHGEWRSRAWRAATRDHLGRGGICTSPVDGTVRGDGISDCIDRTMRAEDKP